MELYWPSSKVYFFGKFALFASNYDGKELMIESFDGFFTNQSVVDLINTLKNYQKDGYFKLSIVFSDKYIEQEIAKLKMSSMASMSPGWRPYKTGKNYGLGIAYKPVKDKNPLNDKQLDFILESFSESELEQYIRITITEIGIEKFKSELTEYLKKYQNDELTTGERIKPEVYDNQLLRLFIAAKHHYSKDKFRPILDINDIWGDYKAGDSRHTFWELILSQVLLTGNIRIIYFNWGDDLHVKKYRGAALRSRVKGVPFAEIEIMNEGMRKFIMPKPKVATPVKSTLSHDEDDEYSYKGITYGFDGLVRFKDMKIPFSFQERQVMRIFLHKPEKLITKDIFTQNQDIFTRDKYPNIDDTLSKLISSVHRKLRQVIGKTCIQNIPEEGWYIKIE